MVPESNIFLCTDLANALYVSSVDLESHPFLYSLHMHQSRAVSSVFKGFGDESTPSPRPLLGNAIST